MSFELNEHDLELMILGDFWRQLRHGIDRIAPDVLGLGKEGKLDWATGRPKSANDLLAPGKITERGERLLRHSYICPWDMAAVHLRRSCDLCESCTADKKDRCELAASLKNIPPSQWTAEEATDHALLENRIQGLFRRWAQVPPAGPGWIQRRPPLTIRKEDEEYDDNDDVWACRITDRGIQAAVERFQGKAPQFTVGGPWSNLADNRRSPLWLMTDDQRRRAPQWMQKEFQLEGGTVTGPPPEDALETLCGLCKAFHLRSAPCPMLVHPSFPPPVTHAQAKKQLSWLQRKRAEAAAWLKWKK
jgi:hypothetical protein